MVYYTTIIAFISTVCTTWLSDFLTGNTLMKSAIVGGTTALCVFSAVFYENIIIKKNKEPSLTVTTNYIGNSLNVKVINEKNILYKASIGFHLYGHVVDIIQSVRESAAVIRTYVEGDQTSEYITNRVEIVMQDIKPNAQLNFTIKLKSPPKSNTIIMNGKISWLNFIDRDIYSIDYIWDFKGEKLYKTDWRTIKEDKPIDMPAFMLSPIRVKGNNYKGQFLCQMTPLMSSDEMKNNPKVNDKVHLIWHDKDKEIKYVSDNDKDKNTSDELKFGPLKRKRINHDSSP